MLRADKVLPAGSWTGTPVDSVVLEFDERYRRRFVMTGVGGFAFLLDLPEAAMLRGGDGLRLEDGRIVEVVAAPEPLAEIRAADALALMRVAWHLGNRHLAVEMTPKALRIRRDPVIEDMAKGLGARVVPVEAPFNPEGGAYVQAEAHGMGDGHGHDHGRHHDHDHDHDHDPATIRTIDHGHDHGHDHSRDEQSVARHCERSDDPCRQRLRMDASRFAARNDAAFIVTPARPSAEPEPALLPLMLWLSPAFPVGSFAYSQGLEWAVEAGDVRDARSLGGWLVDS